jgi:hypothetical protein
MRKKTGGRKKGVPNKTSVIVRDRLEELDCDPIEQLVIIAKEAKESKDLQLAATVYKELAQYIAPKLKSMELTKTGETSEALTIIITKAEGDVKITSARH